MLRKILKNVLSATLCICLVFALAGTANAATLYGKAPVSTAFGFASKPAAATVQLDSFSRLKDLIRRIDALDTDLYTNWEDVMAEPLEEAKTLTKSETKLTAENKTQVEAAVKALETAMEELDCRNELLIDEEGNVVLKSEDLANTIVTGLQMKIYVAPAFDDGVTISFDMASFPGKPFTSGRWVDAQQCINITVSGTSAGKSLMEDAESELEIGKINVKNEKDEDVQASVLIKASEFLYIDSMGQTNALPMPDVNVVLSGTSTAPCKHVWDNGKVKQAATCTEPGIIEYTCELCEEVREETIEAKGHTKEYVPETAATCTQDGMAAHYKCSECGFLWTDAKPDGVTEAELKLKATGHTPAATREGIRSATCTSSGYTGDLKCTVCGVVIEQGKEIPAKGHVAASEREGARAATCTSAGFTGYQRCYVCGAVMDQGKEIPATGHTKAKDREGFKAATCTEDGSTGTLKCTTCGAVIEQAETIKALGHEWKSEWVYSTEQHWRVCKRCNAKSDVASHSLPKTATNAKEATCTEDGYSGDKVCSVCGYVAQKGQVTKALGHDFGKTWQHDDTSHWKECSRCKVKESVAKHVAGTIRENKREATCIQEGYTGDKTCAACGVIMEKGEPIERTGHTYKDGKCTVCGLLQGTSNKPASGDGNTVVDVKPEKKSHTWLTILLGAIVVLGTGAGVVYFAVLRDPDRALFEKRDKGQEPEDASTPKNDANKPDVPDSGGFDWNDRDQN